MWNVAVVMLVVGSLLTGCAGLRQQLSDMSVGQVTALIGEALVRRPEESRPESLVLKSKVFVGDGVRTLKNSRVRITLPSSAILTIGETSELEIQVLAARSPHEPRRAGLKVVMGLLRLAGQFFPAGGPAIEIVTALAAFFLSGTEVIVDVAPTRIAAVSLEGTVRVVSLQKGIPGEIVLKPGEGTDIERGKAPTPPRLWGAARLERVKQATSLP